MKPLFKKSLMLSAVIAASSAMYACQENPTLTRIATAPLGAEFTGMYLNEDGSLFLNVQHPSTANKAKDADGKVFNLGSVGAIVGVDFNKLGFTVKGVEAPTSRSNKELVNTAVGRYQVLLQQTDTLESGVKAGDIVAVDGVSVVKNSNDPDFNGVISDGGTGYYVYSNWEDRAGGMSRIHVDGKTENGYSSISKEGMLDFSGVNGTWVNCFGTVSPWQTPLTSEELYFDDTEDWFSTRSTPQSVASYLKYPTDGSGPLWPNPYDYGYIVEIGVDGTAVSSNINDVNVNKLETLGRFSHENAVVMPDNRTVFLSDDGSNVVFYKFVATQAKDFSEGTLYAAKMQQSAEKDSAKAEFDINWIELGHATEADLESILRSYDGSISEAKHITDAQILAWAEDKADKDLNGDSRISSSPFNDDRPAFFESRKAAKALGATAEFNKMEGVNINYGLASKWWGKGKADGKQAYMYMAMSTVTGGMSDRQGDVNVSDNECGIVYRFKLERNGLGLVDVSKMIPALSGGPYFSDAAVNECDVDGISNPDNLVILNDGRVLIGEDTGNHETNMVWLFNDPAI